MKQTISDRLTDQLKLGLPEAGIHRDPEVVGAEGRSGQWRQLLQPKGCLWPRGRPTTCIRPEEQRPAPKEVAKATTQPATWTPGWPYCPLGLSRVSPPPSAPKASPKDWKESAPAPKSVSVNRWLPLEAWWLAGGANTYWRSSRGR